MKSFVALCVLACALSVALGRQLEQAPAAAAPATPSYASLTEALAAANASAPNLSTFMAAIQAAGVASTLTPSTWTILAPTNDAFTKRLEEDLAMTPQELLLPVNKETLVQVLSYHVIPAGAVLSSQLTDGQQLTTALAGAAPLVVKLKDSKVGFQGATNDAYVVVPDIKAGLSVVHVIDDVLLPAGIGKAPASSG